MTAPSGRVFHLPDLGEGLTEAELVQWLIAVGDTVALDQAIAEVETAKSVVELPSPFAGTVLALHGQAGDVLVVGAPVVEVGVASEARGDDEARGTSEPADPALEAHRTEELAGSGNVLIGYGTSGSHGRGRRRPRPARVHPGTTAATPTAPAVSPATVPQARRETVRVRSPQLRRVARDLGVDLAAVIPTGPGGAVTRADILRVVTADEPAEARAPALASGDTAAGPSEPVEIGRERLGMLRRTVASKMSKSRADIPDATVWVDVDATRLWELRPQFAGEGRKSPSLTALIARFTLLALAEYPLFASRLSDDGSEIIRYAGVNLGLAADTERGLVVPVVPRADRLSIEELDERARTLAAAARAGELPPERLRGSTFTLNNYGSLGVDGSAAIINHPEVAILGVGRMIERPWVVDGAIVARRIVQLSLVFDHRICDGGYAAGFLRRIVDSIERPLTHYGRL